jgi:hypothetical protein
VDPQIVVVHIQKIMMVATGAAYYEGLDAIYGDMVEGLEAFHENHLDMTTKPTFPSLAQVNHGA